MAAKYWIKLYHEILDDYKMHRLSDRLWRRTIELFLLAGDLDADGALPDLEEIAFRLRVNPEDLQGEIAELVHIGILTMADDGLVVTQFAARQAASDSTERSRYFRARQARSGNQPMPEPGPDPGGGGDESHPMGQRNGNGGATKRCTDTEAESDSETEREEESDAEPGKSAAAAGPAPSGLYQAFLEAIHDPDPPPVQTPYPEWESIFAELSGQGVTDADVREAVRWLRANGKHPSHPRGIRGAALTAMYQRGTERKNTVVNTSEDFSARYLKGRYSEFINH